VIQLFELCESWGQESLTTFDCINYFEAARDTIVGRIYQFVSVAELLTENQESLNLEYHFHLHRQALEEEIRFVPSTLKNELRNELNKYVSNSDVSHDPISTTLNKLNSKNLNQFNNEIFKLAAVTKAIMTGGDTWKLINGTAKIDRTPHAFRRLRQSVYDSLNCDAEYHGYIDGSLVATIGEKLTNVYECYGELAVSLVKNLNRERFSEDEEKSIKVLQKLVQDNKRKIKKKIVNRANSTDQNLTANEKDDKRKAYSKSFKSTDDSNTRDAELLIKALWRRYVVGLGICDPRSNPHNAEGEWGVDLLDKEIGCEVQLKHFDFAQMFDKVHVFRSYRDTMSNASKAAAYDPTTDGAYSVFINPFGFADYLMRGDGSFIVIPPYSMLIIRADVLHCGTWNRSIFGGIYKIFFCGDPPKYHRKGHEFQYKVFLPRGHEFHTVVREKDTDEIVKIVIIPSYPCIMCGKSCHYTHPYCATCMSTKWRFKLGVSKGKKVFVTYVGENLPAGFVFPTRICGDMMNRKLYSKCHPDLLGKVICAMTFTSENGKLIDMLLDCFYTRSFVTTIQRTSDFEKGNVTLVYNKSEHSVSLVTLKPLHEQTVLFLYVKYNMYENEEFVCDVDDNMIAEINTI
jgi:hypothetical protein